MARRSGKAANRRSRQRPARRPAARATPTASTAAAPTSTETAHRAPTVTAAAQPAPPAVARPRRSGSTPIGSALAEAARAEYHYVGRDLRNMIVLVVIMAVLLTAAVFVFHAAGIVAS